MKNRHTFFIFLLSLYLIPAITLAAQENPYRFTKGFDAKECDDILKLNSAFLDSSSNNENLRKGYLAGYNFEYRSTSIGLDNVWDLWIRSDSTVIIMLRGTTKNPKSILADFYCAMLPAKGTVHFNTNDSLNYTLAQDDRAAVHGGFLVGFAYVAQDIRPKLDSLYKQGYHHYIVGGHSQGGSLCYYVSAWLHYLSKEDPYRHLQVKTYASAPTKIGNSYFVYDYDNAMRSEWTYSITSSVDPVPEMPFTIQQVVIDMNEPNPILALRKQFDNLSFFKRIFLRNAFNKMEKRSRKSSEAYQKYLGEYLGKMVSNTLPNLKLPPPINTTNFLRPGVPISLLANENYQDFFEKTGRMYYDHDIKAYRFLLRAYYEGLSPLE